MNLFKKYFKTIKLKREKKKLSDHMLSLADAAAFGFPEYVHEKGKPIVKRMNEIEKELDELNN